MLITLKPYAAVFVFSVCVCTEIHSSYLLSVILLLLLLLLLTFVKHKLNKFSFCLCPLHMYRKIVRAENIQCVLCCLWMFVVSIGSSRSRKTCTITVPISCWTMSSFVLWIFVRYHSKVMSTRTAIQWKNRSQQQHQQLEKLSKSTKMVSTLL